MAAIQIDIPQEQIEAITRLAEGQGVSPAEWVAGLVARETRQARRRSKYSVDELLSQGEPSQSPSKEEQEWLNAPVVGREVI